MNITYVALRRSAVIGLTALLALALVACADGAPRGDGATVSVTEGVATVNADDLAFDAGTIQAPAGEAFTIRLTNNENIPHNLSVYTEEGGQRLALGDIINEGETDEIEVPALEPGEYFFVCDLHPAEMQGTIIVEG